MIYAPVIIPTLNRYEHFKRCLDSLECCIWAENTEVYVALDFPPSDKFRPGWEKINSFLETKQFSHRFKKLIIIKREYNYGICHKKSNSVIAINELSTKYDRYIFSEDDNVFSPNFLVFINKGLELYKDDHRIYGVCGYNYRMTFPDMYKNNFYFSKHGSPWGFGTWFSREKEMRRYFDLDTLKGILRDKSSVNKLKKERPTTIYSIIHMIKENRIYEDSVKGCYVTLEDKYWLMPRISKVMNLGTDGTGAHSTSNNKKLIDFFREQEIDSNTDFEFSDDIFTCEPINLERKKMPYSLIKKTYKSVVDRFDLFLFKYFNFVPKSKYI